MGECPPHATPRWLQWEPHPGDWSASYPSLEGSLHTGSVPARCRVGLQRAGSRDQAAAPGFFFFLI